MGAFTAFGTGPWKKKACRVLCKVEPIDTGIGKKGKAMSGLSQQLEVLQRIAAFSAQLRSHQLAPWEIRDYSARTICSTCGREVTVYTSLLQPDIGGDALSEDCGETAVEAA